MNSPPAAAQRSKLRLAGKQHLCGEPLTPLEKQLTSSLEKREGPFQSPHLVFVQESQGYQSPR